MGHEWVMNYMNQACSSVLPIRSRIECQPNEIKRNITKLIFSFNFSLAIFSKTLYSYTSTYITHWYTACYKMYRAYIFENIPPFLLFWPKSPHFSSLSEPSGMMFDIIQHGETSCFTCETICFTIWNKMFHVRNTKWNTLCVSSISVRTRHSLSELC